LTATPGFVEWHALAFHQRIDEIVLVAEVPVDGAAGHAGLAGDVIQRGVGHAAGTENASGRVEQLLARRQGFLFGSPCHLFTTRTRSARGNVPDTRLSGGLL